MTFLCLYISRWWRRTWDTAPYFTVVNQSEARISTEHGIYIYICEFIYPHHWDTLMPATVLLSHAGIGPHYLGGKWSVRTSGVGGRTSGDLRHGTGHQPAPHHPLKYSIPVVTYLSLNLKDKSFKQLFQNISTMPYHLISSSSVLSRLTSPLNCPP